MFWPHAFTSTQSCSIIQIMCRCKDDKATTITCHVMWLVRVVLFKDCPGSLIVIFTLIAAWKISNIGFITMHGLNEGHIAPLPLKKKAMFCTNDPFSSTFMNWWLWCYYWFRRGFSPKSLQPEKKPSCIACGTCSKDITRGTCMKALVYWWFQNRLLST